jgi:hypothetical protein
MRFTTVIKCITLVILGLLTFWATSSIVAQTKSARMKRASQHATGLPDGKAVMPPPTLSTVVRTVRVADDNAPIAQVANPQ